MIALFQRYRLTRRQKLIIEQQKDEVKQQRDIARTEHEEANKQKLIVEEKNKEIVDSINYAQLLQSAILPQLEDFNKEFHEAFVLFRPKDIVSGDFYWMEREGDHVFIAVADCTGHGVPGAMVSVVYSNALSKVVHEMYITEPGKILDHTRKLVIETFKKSGQEVKDGMDIALVSLKKQAQSENESKNDSHSHPYTVLHYAGANNPLWLIKKDGNEVEEIKADKQPVGVYGESKPFTSHEVKLNSGDSIYMFSDEYPDQFGGEKGKKLKSKNFKKLLLEMQIQSMDNQHQELDKAFEEWK